MGRKGVGAMRRSLLFAAIAAFAGVAPLGWAADQDEGKADTAPEPIDLTLYRQGESYLRPTIVLEGAVFSESQAWVGESRNVIGDHVGYWWEYALTGGLEGALALGESGLVYGRASAVGTGTNGLDAAGSNFDDRYPGRLEAEDLYVGWRSGTLFPGLGENALDFSIGKQKYQIGNGFFMWDGGSDGSDRGGYWLGVRKAFYMTAIAKLSTGPYKLEAFYLKPNDEPYTSTDVVGANFEYAAGEAGTVGVTYLKITDSDRARRDDMDFLDWRLSLTPFASDRSFSLAGEFALEVNGSSMHSSAWYGEAGYAFDETFWTPSISYRYAWFEGDDPDTEDTEVWDPLFYGFSDWSTWYVGEIIGEFVTLNRDLGIQTVRLAAHPTDELTVQLIYNYFRLLETTNEVAARDLDFNPRVVDIHSKYIGQEIDLALDWSPNDHLAFSGVAAAFRPGAAMEQFVGEHTSKWWMHFMLYAKVSF
jgi:hypothetical protein